MSENEKINKIQELLGGYNCGGCGYESCQECAKKIVEGEITAEACLPIDSNNLDLIKEILSK